MSRLTRDGTAEPVSRDQILRHARGQGNIIFPVQLTTGRIGNLTRLIHTLLYVMTIHIPRFGGRLFGGFLYSYSWSSSRNSSRFSALERDIAPETAVLRTRPPKTLLEHPPKRTTF